MDQPAQRTDEVPVTRAEQVVVRALPVAAVVIVGLPLVVRLVLDGNGDTRTPWWPVPLLALFVLAVLVDRCARTPRPQVDRRVGDARWRPAFAAAARSGSLPEHPEVRVAVGVVACRTIEGLVIGAAMVVAIVISALAAPGFPWLGALGAPVVLTGMDAVRVPQARAYLRALNAAGRTG